MRLRYSKRIAEKQSKEQAGPARSARSLRATYRGRPMELRAWHNAKAQEDYLKVGIPRTVKAGSKLANAASGAVESLREVKGLRDKLEAYPKSGPARKRRKLENDYKKAIAKALGAADPIEAACTEFDGAVEFLGEQPALIPEESAADDSD